MKSFFEQSIRTFKLLKQAKPLQTDTYFPPNLHKIFKLKSMMSLRSPFQRGTLSIGYKPLNFFTSPAKNDNYLDIKTDFAEQSIFAPDAHSALTELGDLLAIESLRSNEEFRQLCIYLQPLLNDELAFLIEKQALTSGNSLNTAEFNAGILAALGMVILPIHSDENKMIFCEAFQITLHDILNSHLQNPLEESTKDTETIRILLFRAFPELLKGFLNEPKKLAQELRTIDKLEGTMRRSLLETLAFYLSQDPNKDEILEKLFWFQDSHNENAIKDLSDQLCLYLTPLINFIK